MAALRSSLATLRRSLSGRGLETNQVFPRAAPPLHPAAIRNVEGCQSFSTGIREPADKVEGGMRMWPKRVFNRIKYANLEEKTRGLFVYALFVLGTPTTIMLRKIGRI